MSTKKLCFLSVIVVAQVLLMSSCYRRYRPSGTDGIAVSAVVSAWNGNGALPPAGDCLELVEVRRHDSLSRYVDACDGSRPGLYGPAARDSAGCLTSALRGVIGRRVWLVHVAPGYHDDPTIVGHELRHALTYCHLDRPRSDPFDAGHSDPRVWEGASKDPAVRAASVEARARLVTHQGVLGGP